MENQKGFRQGDVILIRTDKEKSYAGDVIQSNVIAEGEVTGHKHEVIDGKVYGHRWDSNVRYIESNQDTVLVHNEHKPIKLGEGFFEIRIQREYDELNNKFVAD